MRKDGEPNLPELTEALIGEFPTLDDVKRRVALATYRRLARGEPAPRRGIAIEAGLRGAEVRRILGDWIGVYSGYLVKRR